MRAIWLLREVTAAVIEVCGADRVGVRLSPINPTNGSHDSDPAATYGQAAADLRESRTGEPPSEGDATHPASSPAKPAVPRG